jgi:hypothetical protein
VSSIRAQPGAPSTVCSTLLCEPLITASGTMWQLDQACSTSAAPAWTVIGKAWSRASLRNVYSCITTRIAFALPRV